MRKIKIILVIGIILLLIATIIFGAFAQNYVIGSAKYHILSACAVLGCIATFIALFTLLIYCIIDYLRN